MSSRRLPGKVLQDCAGMPMLLRVIKRCQLVKQNIPVAIVTSDESSDDFIFDFCLKNQIQCFRGSLHNVLNRYIKACDFYNLQSFIRISGDSPLIDPTLIENLIKISNEGEYDLVSNVKDRTYPKGQSIEIIKVDALNRLSKIKLDKAEREHVTLGIYRNEYRFKIKSISWNEDEKYDRIQLSVDSEYDMRLIEKILMNSEFSEDTTWLEYVRLYNSVLDELVR